MFFDSRMGKKRWTAATGELSSCAAVGLPFIGGHSSAKCDLFLRSPQKEKKHLLSEIAARKKVYKPAGKLEFKATVDF